jgi:redox-sensitive bicupin YhaK (pirin superfamily)
LEGDLAHKDSMGNESTIKTGDVQVMSAGTGIQHSEFNPNADLQTKLFQIWLFPKYRNVTPRYQQITLDVAKQKNDFAQILSPNAEDEGVWIYQDAWFHLADFNAGFSKTYEIKKAGNGLYVFVISGTISVNSQELETRDGFGIWNFQNLEVTAITDAKFLLMEIPMD